MNPIYLIPKLCYEILNKPLASIADDLGLPVSMVEKEACDGNWFQWFPDTESDHKALTEREQDELEGTDLFTLRAEQYIERNRKRIQLFTLAKDVVMLEKYADIELNLLVQTREALNSLDTETTNSLKTISSIYKDMIKQITTSNTALSMGKDEQTGLPTVIIRDLSGS
jgi:hypothetical protein